MERHVTPKINTNKCTVKAIYFDMDGTIADLYGYPSWLEALRAERIEPYIEYGDCLDNINELVIVLDGFKALGITIGVISWGAKNATTAYTRKVKSAKRQWIKQRYPQMLQEFHVVKYGTPKHKVRKIQNSILVDDNAEVREQWDGDTIDATDTKKMLKSLQMILDALTQEQ